MISVFKHIVLAVVLTAVTGLKAQTTDFLLHSKMDVWPQYPLHDGNLIRIMGFTELIGTPIDLPSPVLIFNEGDSIDLGLKNFSQPAHHTIHLHGLDVEQAMDGVPHLSFSVPHDSTGHYIFVAPHAGTYLYHCHVVSTLHVQSGMYGLIIIRPPDGSNSTWDGGYAFDREHAWLFSEIDTNWHQNHIINAPHDPNNPSQLILDYEPQYFLVNGHSDSEISGTESSYLAAVGETVYLRLANIGYYGNRVIIPSALNAQIIDSDGRPLPSVVDSDTVEIMPGERYGVLLTASSEFTDSISVEYFNLNTQEVVNTQYPPVLIEGFIGFPKPEKEKMSIFPNPTNSNIYVSFIGLNNISGEVHLTDASGKQILSESILVSEGTNMSLSTDGLASGVYFVQFNSETIQLTEKLIIE